MRRRGPMPPRGIKHSGSFLQSSRQELLTSQVPPPAQSRKDLSRDPGIGLRRPERPIMCGMPVILEYDAKSIACGDLLAARRMEG